MPGMALLAHGADVIIDTTGPTVEWSSRWPGCEGDQSNSPPDWVSVRGIHKYDRADVVVMQRPSRRWWTDIIPLLQAQGIRVIVDIDDRFDKIDKGNVAKGIFDPRYDAINNYTWVTQAAQLADKVTVTTPSLLKAYGFGHGVVLPNYVPERYLFINGFRPTSVAWTGNIGTHPRDLQVTGGAVGQVLNEQGWNFHVVGTGHGVQQALQLSEPPTTTGWVPFADYPEEMAKATIGIVPLADTVFNEGKSCLKMIEFASLGVPVIASPTADNVRMHQAGVGLLAKTPQKWRTMLSLLMDNREQRLDIAGRSRDVIAKQFTYSAHCDRWWAAWTGEKRRR